MQILLKGKLNGTRAVVYCAFFVAVLVVLSQVAVPLPFSPVPFTLAVLAVLLAGCFCGPWLGLITITVYIAMGAVGLPVFASFGSTAALVGPTGGYIFGYLPMAFLAGLSTKLLKPKSQALQSVHTIQSAKEDNKKSKDEKNAVLSKKSKLLLFVGLALSVLSCYAFGTIWYAIYADIKLYSAFLLCVVPFVPFDGVKIALAGVVFIRVCKARRIG